MSVQRYLPIFEEDKRILLGLLDLGANVEFDGTETEYELDVPPGGDGNIVIRRIDPPTAVTGKVNPWFMAAIFTREQVYLKAHRGYEQFIDIKDVSPGIQWSSGSGLATYLTYFKGLALQGLENKNGFGQNVIS